MCSQFSLMRINILVSSMSHFIRETNVVDFRLNQAPSKNRSSVKRKNSLLPGAHSAPTD